MSPALYVGQILSFAFPVVVAGILHMGVVAADLLAPLKAPLDGGRSWRGRRIFGDNKTWRGIALMPLLTGLCMWGQAWAYASWAWARALSPLDLTFADSAWTPFLAGCVFGLGYVLAELPNSFVKRRMGVVPGARAPGRWERTFVVVDQADSVVGCLLFALAFWIPPWHFWLATLGLCVGLHLLLNYALYLAGLRKQPV